MSKSEIIDKLVSQMGTLNEWFISYTAALIGVVIFVCGFIVFSQKSELKKMKEQVDAKLETINQKQQTTEKALSTISKNTVLLAAGRPFMQGITHWHDMLDIYNLAKSGVFATDQFHLEHLRSAVVFSYLSQLQDEQIITGKEKFSLFKTERIDGYDTAVDVYFDKLTDKLQTIKDTNKKIAAFKDLALLQQFWEKSK